MGENRICRRDIAAQEQNSEKGQCTELPTEHICGNQTRLYPRLSGRNVTAIGTLGRVQLRNPASQMTGSGSLTDCPRKPYHLRACAGHPLRLSGSAMTESVEHQFHTAGNSQFVEDTEQIFLDGV